MSQVPSVEATDAGPAPRRLLEHVRARLSGFAVLHLGNTALNMAFTLLQLLVLARILPLDRYADVVFLTSLGLYLQPLDQAVGRANFVALRAAGDAGRPHSEPGRALRAQATLLLAVALGVPCLLAPFGSAVWSEDVLFLFLSLSINLWAFDLQSTAWAVERNLSFVRLSLLHRALHVASLALAWWSGSFILFTVVASAVTAGCLCVAVLMLARAGIFEPAGARRPLRRAYLRLLGLSFGATLADFAILNAPYALIAATFGIGPTLIAFDSVLKLARIAQAGARTFAEIALPRYGTFLRVGDHAGAARLYWGILLLCIAAAAVPALAVLVEGPRVFGLLLGSNNVVPAIAGPGAALVILAAGLYQPATFFIGYGSGRGPIGRLTLSSACALLAFAMLMITLHPETATVLLLFGLCFLALAMLAAWLAHAPHRASHVVAAP